MKNPFQKALPIFAKEQEGVLNSSLFFRIRLDEKDSVLRIAGHNFYRLYLDGQFFAYGPSRGAHDIYRVDEYPLPSGARTLVIELSASHCCSFYALDRPGFLCFETLDSRGEALQASSLQTEIFLNATRFQKVTRFSFQRAFSESLTLDASFPLFLKGEATPYPRLTPIAVAIEHWEKRIVDYLSYPESAFAFLERGTCGFDPSLPIYRDRYQTTEFLKIYPEEEWERDTNRIASTLSFSKEEKKEEPTMRKGEFRTFGLDAVRTGFFRLEVEVRKEATLYLLFDEMDVRDPKNPDLIGISFYRNTTHNCVTYELRPGKYDLVTFEPYAVKYLRLALLDGELALNRVALIRYENPAVERFRFRFDDPKISSVFEAARNTFAQNAVDLLTDCPSRERAGWLCDSFFSGQAEPFLTGNNKNEEAFLDNYASCSKEYLPEGMIPPCYPADFPSKEFIPNWALWYILELSSFALRHPGHPVLEKSLPNVRGILDYFRALENEFGLLEDLQGWIFVEWSKANDPDHVCGVNAPSNMVYAEALIQASALLGEPALKEKGEAIKDFIRRFFFRGDFFVDNAIRDDKGALTLTDHTTETCQYYAFYFNVASKETHGELFETMRRHFGQYRDDKTVFPNVAKSNVLMGILMRLCVLNRYGYFAEVFAESVDYFANMAALTGTLWENDSPCASLNHCFASYIVPLLLEANFGVLYVDQVRKEIHVRRHALHGKGTVSIPLGAHEELRLESDGEETKMTAPSSYRVVEED